MTSSAARAGARAKRIEVTRDDLCVDLEDGRKISVPLAWYPALRTRLHDTSAGSCKSSCAFQLCIHSIRMSAMRSVTKPTSRFEGGAHSYDFPASRNCANNRHGFLE